MQSKWDQHAILLEGRKISPPGVSQHSRGGVRLGLTYKPATSRRSPRMLPGKMSCIRTRRAPPGRSGSRHTLQVTSPLLMEYSPLAWSSCPPSYLRLLDRVQARAQRLARLKAPEAAAQIIQPLQQRRDVAGMCVMYKAHRMQLLQLARLRLNPRTRPLPFYPCGPNIAHQVTVPFGEDGTLPPLLPTPLWATMEHLGTPDRPASDHFHEPSQNGRKWRLQAELTQ
ncbi:hypothetical protein GWK47_010845 [Chionoecetes opilio]|uniref:Uncharacterized protein n=1 Tax=Chionoecetes opilio TaxID=41210 RepID=A0A8J5C310_CHIOP|nr:hypothetical protein GWK47_010845 [Chionoecetes opilio]